MLFYLSVWQRTSIFLNDIVSVIYLLKKFICIEALVTRPTDERTVGRPANTIIREARVTLALDKVSLETYQKISLRKKTKGFITRRMTELYKW